MRSRGQKFSLTLLTILILTVSAVGVFGAPQPAQAQQAVSVIASLPDTARTIFDQIWQGLKTAVLGATARIVSYAMRKIAYDSAVWLASGGKGQGPLAQTKGFGDYLKNVADDALGQGIEELGKSISGNPDFNICKIPDIKVDLALKIGLRTGFADSTDPTKKPACSFSEFTKEWLSGDAWKSKYDTAVGGKSLSERFSASLNVDDTELGIQIKTTETIDKLVRSKTLGKLLGRQEGQGFLPKTSLISDQILTPSALVQKTFEGVIPSKVQESDEEQVRALLTSGEIRVIPNVLGIFLNSLVSSMVKNYQDKGILPFGIGCKDGSEDCFGRGKAATQYDAAGISGNLRSAQEIFNYLLTVEIDPPSEYDLLGAFGNCEGKGIYNCRADADLIQAAKETEGGSPVTIAEALKRGWLHGDRQLIPPSRAENSDRAFCARAYCYTNIKVLRQTRLLPLGFEIAAESSPPDRPWTLDQVVGNGKDTGFYDCARDKNGRIIYDPINKPFCRLIDPNWVIRAPATRCDALVNTAVQLAADLPTRLQDCADLKNCVAYNADGTCATFGYCTRERNVWRFSNADSCQAQYRTCRTFRDADTGRSVSYLYRTLDTSFCSEATAGCQAYSVAQNTSGQWLTPSIPRAANGFAPTAIFFNSQLPVAACGPNSAGCTAYQPAANLAADPIYLRQAPNYLGCYDSNPNQPGTQWPKNAADLTRLPGGDRCSEYAQACIKDEVGCSWYTAADTGERLPAKYTPAAVVNGALVWGDQCAPECRGYDTYREMPSNYSAGVPLVHIIPDPGAACQAKEAGCSSFTNLSTTAGGLEQVEHFAYLRPCALPDKNAEKNFITYEGSTQGGFQLKVYTLLKDAAGGPKYFYRTLAELAEFQAECNAPKYQSKTVRLDWAADCRQFNDEAGRTFYRLLSKTIPTSPSCSPYRLNTTELYPIDFKDQQGQSLDLDGQQKECGGQQGFWNSQANQCELCFQNGEYRDGFCFYYGLPGGVASPAEESVVCPAEAESCREYKGPGGNQVRQVLAGGTETFEKATLKDLPAWQGLGLALSPESTHAGEQSLGGAGAGAVLTRALKGEEAVIKGNTYTLTFWAKGSGENLTVTIALDDQSFSGALGGASVGDAWRYYRLGPLTLGGSPADPASSAVLIFANSKNGLLFIDNLNLREAGDSFYLVKKKLKVPELCDSAPNDNLPGEALGCREYNSESNNQPVHLKNFSYLCRDQAIGCTAVLNTQNTLQGKKALPGSLGPQLHQLWLTGAGGSPVELKLDGVKIAGCQIEVGGLGCYASVSDVEPSELLDANRAELSSGRPLLEMFVTSTVYIPPDSPSTTPLYLVNAPEAAGLCREQDIGCMYAGVERDTPQGPRFTTATIKNDPALYQTTLCPSQSLGCRRYSMGEGETFFKDPETTGQKVCAYKTEVPLLNGGRGSGWFWKGVGVCRNNTKKLCAADADCGANSACIGIDAEPCYPTYIEPAGAYGLWSFGDTGRYQQFVGECPSAANLCSEFIDRNNANRADYFIKNSKISEGDCSGQVSEKFGCALFDDTGNPAKYWSTAKSYAASASNEGRLVPPVVDAKTNDANVIIKVKRDRECGEWLSCARSHRVFDARTGQFKQVCDAVGRCDEAGCGPRVANAHPNQPLTPRVYFDNFDGAWASRDFSGYSLLNFYPLEELIQFNVSTSVRYPDWRLVKPVPCGSANCADNAPPTSVACKANFKPCGYGGQPGLCVNGTCVQGARGGTNQALSSLPTQRCRAYPESDSPFPNTERVKQAQEFYRVNKCQEEAISSPLSPIGYACECDYTKAVYGDSLTLFFNYRLPNSLKPILGPLDKPTISVEEPDGICQGGARQGKACATNDDCYRSDNNKNPPERVTDGICLVKTKTEKWIGWRGFCLEGDEGRVINADSKLNSCLSWYPVDALSGTLDINNQHVEAGYQPPPLSGRYYCLASPGNKFSQPVGDSVYAMRSNLYFGSNNAGSGDKDYGDPNTVNNSDQFQRSSYAPEGDEANLRQPDIEKIILTVSPDQPNPDEPDDPVINTQFEIWPNDNPAADYLGPQVSYTVRRRGGATGVAVTGPYLGKKNEFILLYSSNSDYLQPDGSFCYPRDCTQVSGNVFRPKGLKIRGVATDPGLWDYQFKNEDICDENGAGGNWHALRFRFNEKTKEFTGYKTAYCDDSGGSGEIQYTVRVRVRQLCTSVADVNIDPKYEPRGNFTVAATNLLWKSTPYVMRSLNYEYLTPSPPFGSLRLPALNPFESIILSEFQVPNVKLNSGCPSDGTTECVYHRDNQASTIANKDLAPPYVPGAPYSCPNGSCGKTDENGKTTPAASASGKSVVSGRNSLAELFPRVKQVYDFDFQTPPNSPRYYTGFTPTLLPLWDLTESGGRLPPEVRPLGECAEEERCVELGAPGVTVNDRSSGDTVLPANGSPVVIKFFGEADSDRMPIRDIKVDWGDDTTPQGVPTGYYRNHRGLTAYRCGAADANQERFCERREPPNIIDNRRCSSDSDCWPTPQCVPAAQNPRDFGHIEGQTCNNAYFRFESVYTCLEGGPGWQADRAVCNQSGLSGGCCVFVPKAQLKDNWGWCNGNCGRPDPGGCYDGQGKNECSRPEAWTKFDGRVIVPL